MKVSKLKGSNKRTGLCRLSINGEMTIYAAAEMLQVFFPYWQDYRKFELDLAEVSEIDTAGLQLLLQFQRKAKQAELNVQILSCSQAVQDLIVLYRLAERFDMPDIQMAS